MPLPSLEQDLSGWGRFPTARCRVLRPERDRELADCVGVLPRGMGRSYGDAALNKDGGVVSTQRLDRMLAFDANTGLLEAEAGLSLGVIAQTFLPRGWFLPVTPGTKFVSLGGAVAGDVHGKNHHLEGSFSRHVEAFELLCPNGDRISCSRQSYSDVFEATVGGMGLTGLITNVRLRLRKVAGPWMYVRHKSASDLDQIFQLLSDRAAPEPYSVAWIDCLARGRHLGRSVLMVGDHADGPVPAPRVTLKSQLRAPMDLPGWVLHPSLLRAFNAAFHRYQARKTLPFLTSPDAFFYPLDGIRNWNRLYGRQGFVQYQCVLPEKEAFAGVQVLLELISAAGAASFLAVLKRLGEGSEGLLSFCMPGFTLALDIPFKGKETLALVQSMDLEVVRRGGRVNLCKDACLSPETFRAMYPRAAAWRDIKRRLDPDGLIQSGLSRRIHLLEED